MPCESVHLILRDKMPISNGHDAVQHSLSSFCECVLEFLLAVLCHIVSWQDHCGHPEHYLFANCTSESMHWLAVLDQTGLSGTMSLCRGLLYQSLWLEEVPFFGTFSKATTSRRRKTQTFAFTEDSLSAYWVTSLRIFRFVLVHLVLISRDKQAKQNQEDLMNPRT